MRTLGRKGKAKKRKRSSQGTEKKEKTVTKGIGDTVKELYELISTILRRFAYKVSVRVKRLDIRVACGDAANTALTYAAVCTSLDLLRELLCGYDKLKCSIDSMSCECDFLSESFSVDTDIEIKIRVYNILLSVVSIIADTLNKK